MTGVMRSLAAAGAAAAPPTLAMAALGAAIWMVHVLRLRRRERQLLAIIGRMTREAAAQTPGSDDHAASPRAGVAGAVPGGAVLLYATRSDQPALAAQLAALGVGVGLADSAWAVQVACREALEAGAPYNLLLAEASVPEAADGASLARFEAAAVSWGAQVAVVRRQSVGDAARSMARRALGSVRPDVLAHDDGRLATGGEPEEGIGPDEDPDRGGRGGFAAPAAADASALGLRGRRSE